MSLLLIVFVASFLEVAYLVALENQVVAFPFLEEAYLVVALDIQEVAS
jgi:hypothetical protein